MTNSQHFKILISAFLLLVASFAATANNVITKSENLPLDRNKYSVDETDFLDPGDNGDNILWDFAGASISSKSQNRRYRILGDSIMLRSTNSSQQLYHITGDSLILMRIETPRAFFADTAGIFLARFPISFGDNYTSPCNLVGEYSQSHAMALNGTISVVADAQGTLILPDDTLHNVLRIHKTIQGKAKLSSFAKFTHADSIPQSWIDYTHNEYYWYAPGYRYPVCESQFSIRSYGNHSVSVNNRSYIFPPAMQDYYFDNNNDDDTHHKDNGKGNNDNSLLKGKISNIKISKNSTQIDIALSVSDGDIEIETTLFDLNGRIYGYIPPKRVSTGYYSDSIDCSKLLPGKYVITIRTGTDRHSEYIFL